MAATSARASASDRKGKVREALEILKSLGLVRGRAMTLPATLS
jgi:predicted transcriptional regulator